MKTIGLVGGTGWISTAEYYRIINEEINRRCGGLNFARCVLYSINYGEINECNQKNDRAGVYSLIRDASKKLVDAGVDCLLLCANTLHQFAEDIQKEISVPLIHIGEAAAKEVNKQGSKIVGLLGTRQTMVMDFYKKKLQKEDITSLIPGSDDRIFIEQTITNELLKGIFLKESKDRFIRIIKDLNMKGAECIVLGCTEIPLLIKQKDVDIPLINTLEIHAQAAVDFALSD